MNLTGRAAASSLAVVGMVSLAGFLAGQQGGGRGGAGPVVSTSVRLENWGRLHLAAPGIIGWRVGVRSDAFGRLPFSEAAARIDALNVAFVEGFGGQEFSREIPKKLDYNLAPGELTAVKDRLRSLNLQMPVYFAPVIGDENAARKLFQFAKGLAVETIVGSPDPASLAMIDKLANEFSVNMALYNRSRKETPGYWNAESLLKAVEGRSKRIGAYIDVGAWTEEGLNPVAELTALKERLIGANLSFRSTRGGKDHDTSVMAEINRLGLKPSFITVDAHESVDLSKSLESLDKALQPIMAESIAQFARATPIQRPDLLANPEERRRMEAQLSTDLQRYDLTLEDVKRKIDAALPQQSPAKPKRPRKLLILDLCVGYNGHLANRFAVDYALDLMGKKTGAWETVLSNDLDNLKYEKIKQFDAVYLNNTVGTLLVDQQVRDGLSRFVREGGGLAGNHGTGHAEMDWPEFGEMLGTYHGTHRENTEKAMVKIDDPKSPLTSAFAGQEFLHQDEFFRFPDGPYSREKLHVLLSMDVAKTDMNQGLPCSHPCSRADNDYGLSWIHNYGKGRVFFCALGHRPTLLTNPAMASYFMSGIQFILGDLEADTTPSARLSTKR